MKVTKIHGALLVTVALAGCGKIGPNGPDQSLGGFYNVQLTPSGANAPNSGTALINELGFGWILDQSAGTLYFINSAPDGNVLTGSFRAYASGTFSNGASVVTGELRGTISERASVTGTAVSTLGTAPFVLTYFAPAYTIPASFTVLAGNYQYDLDNVTVSISIDSAGRLTGSDTGGCTINGLVTIPDRTYNAYAFTATNTCAGAAPQSLAGLAAYVNQSGATPAQLVLAYSDNAAFAAYAVARRL